MERTTPAVGARCARFVSSGRWRVVALGVGVLALGGVGGALGQDQGAKPQAAVPAATPELDQKAKTLLQQGKESWEAKNYERVLRKYRQFVSEFPNRPEVTDARYYIAISMTEMANTDWNAVADELSKVAASANVPDKGNSNYWLGVALRVIGEQQLDAARKNNNPAQRKDQETRAKQRLEQAAKAFETAEAALAKESPDLAARARVEGAQTLALCGKSAEALERVRVFATDPALAKSASRAGGLLMLGQAQFEAKDYPGAFATLAMIAPFDQPWVGIQARCLLGQILEETDQKPEAVVQYEAVIKSFTEEKLKAQRALADPNAWKGRVLERIAAEAMTKGTPQFVVQANFRAAMIQFGYGQYAEAMPKFRQVVTLPAVDEIKPIALLHVGICGVQTKQPEIARVLDSLREHPKVADQAWMWIGRMQRSLAEPTNPGQAQNQYKAALASFTTAHARAQQMAAAGDAAAAARRGEILLDQADTLALLKQFKEAATVYDALAKDASDADRAEIAGEKLAMALHKAGDYSASEAACARFLEKYPQSVLRGPVMFWQAENAQKQGQKDVAVARYAAVLEKYPEFPQASTARFGLGMALYAKGDYAKAQRVLNGIAGPDRQGELMAASYYEADCMLRTAPQGSEDALSAARLAKVLEEATALLAGYAGSNESTPEMPEAMVKLADCYQRTALIVADQQEKARLYQGARETYDRLVQRYPRHPAMARAVLDRALMLAATGDAGSAINELNRFRSDTALARTPTAPAALMKLSELMVKNGRAVDAAVMMEKARADFEKEMSNPAMIAQMRYHHGVALRESGKGKEALALFEGIIKNWPDSAEAAEASLASIQVKQKEALDKLKSARQAIVSAPADQPSDPKLLAVAQDAMKGAGEIGEAFAKHAEQIAQKAEGSDLHVRTLRDAAVTWRAVGEAEVQSARRVRAEESLKKLQAKAAAKPRPEGKSNSQPHAPQIRLAAIPVQPGEKRARELYAKALDAGAELPIAGEIRLELAEMLIARGEADGAIQLISAAIDQNPPQPILEALRIKLGRCCLLKNDVAGALAQAEECLKDTNSPIRPQAYLLKGQSMLAQKSWAEAVTVFTRYMSGAEKYVNAGPVTEEGLKCLAEAYAGVGAWEQSRAAYEHLLARFGNGRFVADARFGMGYALQKLRQFDRAVEQYQEVVRRSNSETAAKAQHQIGLCRGEQQRWQDAVNELLVVPVTYDYAEVSANSSLEAAKALVQLKKKDQAKEVLKGVVEDHPMTSWAQEAQKRLAEIQ
jgi:cellulose synthase operon protein C